MRPRGPLRGGFRPQMLPPPPFARPPMSPGLMRSPMPPRHLMSPLSPRPPMPPLHGMRGPPGFRSPRGMRPPHPGMMPPGPRMMSPRPLMGPRPRGGFNRVQNGKIMKRPFTSIDLGKPWVSQKIKAEFTKKEALLMAAKATQTEEDWATYRGQRDKCNKVYQAAKMEYIGSHPELGLTMEDEGYSEDHEQEEYSYFEAEGAKLTCDSCDKDFESEYLFREHMSQHRTCGLEGCTFTAHEVIIEKHIRMQHCTGLYDQFRNISTPEDIAKWIAERKKRYPTKRNIEIKCKQKEEMIKRGERIGVEKRKNNKNKNRYCLKPNVRNRNKKLQKTCTVLQKQGTSIIDEKSDWNGSLCPFRGTKELYGDEEDLHEENINDDEWEESAVQSTDSAPTKLTNALGMLMNAYSDSEQSDLEQHSSMIKPDAVEDDEPPAVEKISRDEINPIGLVEENIPQVKSNCRKRSRNARSSFKKKRKREEHNNNNNDKREGVDNTVYFKRPVTLLEMLLANDIQHERNVLLQCVRHVVRNNFLDKSKSCDNIEVSTFDTINGNVLSVPSEPEGNEILLMRDEEIVPHIVPICKLSPR